LLEAAHAGGILAFFAIPRQMKKHRYLLWEECVTAAVAKDYN